MYPFSFLSSAKASVPDWVTNLGLHDFWVQHNLTPLWDTITHSWLLYGGIILVLLIIILIMINIDNGNQTPPGPWNN